MDSGRRPRGSLVEPRKVGIWLETRVDDRLNQLAAAAGTSKSAITQWLIERVELDADGRPVGWDADHPREEELPIDSP